MASIPKKSASEWQYLYGKLPPSFSKAVGLLQRPYSVIDEIAFNEIVSQLTAKDCDFFVYKEQICTVGEADNGFAIMPLSGKYQKIVIKNSRLAVPEYYPFGKE